MWRQLRAVLGSWLLAGCIPEGGPSELPDSVGARVAFAPDGVHALVLSTDRAYAYDLEAERVIWRRQTTPGQQGVAFSPRGRYAVLVESEDTTVRVSVLDVRDGRTLGTFHFAQNPLSPERVFELAGSLCSVSDDGRYLVVAPDQRGQQLDLFSIETGRRMFHDESEGGFVLSVAFEPDTHRLAAYSSATRVWVVDEKRESFAVVRSLAGVWPTWTARGLGYGSARGLELWREDTARVALDRVPAYHLESWPGDFEIERLSAPSPRWSYSDDGDWLAIWNDVGFRIHRTSDGRPIFDRRGERHSSGYVTAARWAPNHFRTFLMSGDYLDVDLERAKVVRAEGFGEQGSFAKSWLHEGAAFERAYHGLLSPTGKWFDRSERGEPHQLIKLE